MLRRAVIAIGVLSLLAFAALKTMEPGRVRLIVLVILAGFGLRVIFTARATR